MTTTEFPEIWIWREVFTEPIDPGQLFEMFKVPPKFWAITDTEVIMQRIIRLVRCFIATFKVDET